MILVTKRKRPFRATIRVQWTEKLRRSSWPTLASNKTSEEAVRNGRNATSQLPCCDFAPIFFFLVNLPEEFIVPIGRFPRAGNQSNVLIYCWLLLSYYKHWRKLRNLKRTTRESKSFTSKVTVAQTETAFDLVQLTDEFFVPYTISWVTIMPMFFHVAC